MDNPPRTIKVTPKENTAPLVMNSLLVIFIVIIFLMVAFWVIIQNKSNKAPLLIQSDGQSDPEVYSENEVNSTYASTGYAYSGLQMPCTQEENKAALPNLPEAYKVTNCDSLSKRICVDGYVKGGGICLSTLGGACRSLYDCASGANACLNNVCVNTLELDTINQPCITDYDCSVEGQNHICDPKFKICKYNYFPYESGCQIDQDCLSNDAYNKNACIFVKSDGLSVSGKVGEFKIIIPDTNQDGLNYFFIGSVVSAEKGDSFITFNITSSLINFPGEGDGYRTLQNPSKYFTEGSAITIFVGNTGGGQLGICVSKIPRGGKRITIAGVKIPCEDGLIDSDGFCVENNFYSTYGVVCDKQGNIPSLKCKPDTFLDKFSKTVRLECLGDVNIQSDFARNFNYTYPSLFDASTSTEFRDEVKYLGYCSYELADYQQPCDPQVNNCAKPYLCLTAIDQNGTDFSFCGTDFNRQECLTNSECSNGYVCGSENICLSEEDNICYTDSDVGTGLSCLTGGYLYYYSLELERYVQIGDEIPGNSQDVELRFGSEIITDNNSYKGLPKRFVLWKSATGQINRPSDYASLNGYKDIADETYSGDMLTIYYYVYNNTDYTLTSTIVYLYPGENVSFADVLITNIDGASEKIYTIYQTPAIHDRIRRAKILELLPDNRFSLPINCGFVDGDRVIYRSDADVGNYSESVTYYIYRSDTGSTVQDFTIYSYYLSDTEGGDPVSQTGPYVNTGELISYSNTYTLQAPIHSDVTNVSPLLTQSFQTGDQVFLQSGSLTITSGAVEKSMSSGDSAYLLQTSEIDSYSNNSNFDVEDSYFYHLSDEYNPGTVAYYDGSRTTFQSIYSENEVTMTLNPNLISHSIALVQTDSVGQYIVRCDGLVDGRRNGINAGIMYNLDEGVIPKFSIDGNQLLISARLDFSDPSSSDASDMDSFSFVQEVNIQTSSGDHQLSSGVYMGGSTTTTDFYFTYQNTASPPQPKYLYFDQQKTKDQNIDFSIPNPLNFGDENSLNIITSYTENQQISVNDDPTVLLASELQKTGYTDPGGNDQVPILKYNNTGLEARYFEMDIYDLARPGDVPLDQNTYNEGSNFLTFRNSSDIDLILKYGWSELVFMKVSDSIEPPSLTGNDFYNSNFFTGNGQVILISVGIYSYDVTVGNEILVIQTNVPLNTESGPRREILTQKLENGEPDPTWRFYPYNIHPLYTKRMVLNSTVSGELFTNMYNFFDASGLYTSTKKEGYLNEPFNETSYNKIFTVSASKDSEQTITIINVHSGYGYVENDSDDPYQSQIIATPTTNAGETYTIFLPSLIPFAAVVGQFNYGTASTTTDINKRSDGKIFGYFFPVTTRYLGQKYTQTTRFTTSLFNGSSFISNIDDYGDNPSEMNLDKLSYLRPIFSGMVYLRYRGPSQESVMYGVNNLYLSSIPKSIPNKPYYNFKTTDVYYSISSSGKRKGDITLGVDTYPYYPLISGTPDETLDQSYEKIVRWPEWILDNKLIVYTDTPLIRKIFISTNGGNLGGKLEYYVQATIDEKNNLYLFSSSNDRESIVENEGIPTTKSIYDGRELIGGVFNNQFYIVAGKSFKTLPIV